MDLSSKMKEELISVVREYMLQLQFLNHKHDMQLMRGWKDEHLKHTDNTLTRVARRSCLARVVTTCPTSSICRTLQTVDRFYPYAREEGNRGKLLAAVKAGSSYPLLK